MSCSSTLARPSCIPQYGAYERDESWGSLWLVRRGGQGGDGAALGDGDKEDVKKVEREDPRRSGTQTPFTPLHLCLFNYLHLQNGYACASPPSSPVYASRPILTQLEDPQAWETTREGTGTADPAHSTAARPRTLQRVPPTNSGSMVRVAVRPNRRRQKHGVCRGTTPASRRPPPPFVQCQHRLRRCPRRTRLPVPPPRTPSLSSSQP